MGHVRFDDDGLMTIWNGTILTDDDGLMTICYGTILTDDDCFRDPPVPAVLDDGLGELAGVVPWPVQGSVTTALHGDQSAVGAGDEP